MIRFVDGHTLPLRYCLADSSNLQNFKTLSERTRHSFVEDWRELAPFITNESDALYFFTNKNLILRHYQILLYFQQLVECSVRRLPLPIEFRILTEKYNNKNNIGCLTWFWDTCQTDLQTDYQQASLLIIVYKIRQRVTYELVAEPVNYTFHHQDQEYAKFNMPDFIRKVYAHINEYVHNYLVNNFICKILRRQTNIRNAVFTMPYFTFRTEWPDVWHFEKFANVDLSKFSLLVNCLRIAISRRFSPGPFDMQNTNPYKFAFYLL